jgi:hypothetical protein
MTKKIFTWNAVYKIYGRRKENSTCRMISHPCDARLGRTRPTPAVPVPLLRAAAKYLRVRLHHIPKFRDGHGLEKQYVLGRAVGDLD